MAGKKSAILLLFLAFLTAFAEATNCPSGWTLRSNYCYGVVATYTTMTTWAVAEQSCANSWPGGHLAWITSAQENQFLVNMTQSYSYTYSFWIGLEKPCPSPSGVWHWSSQQNMTYQNFVSFPPSGSDSCTDFYGPSSGSAGVWDTDGCSYEKTGYVCKAPKSGTTPPPPINFQAGCPTNWCRLGNFCYWTSSQQLQWVYAQAKCQVQGGNLVSIHSMAENNFTRLMADTANGVGSEFWIGLNILNGFDGQFRWSDNSPSDFTNWLAGQPDHNNYYNTESCASIFSDAQSQPNWRGKWNDDRCDVVIPYICKKYAHGYTPPPVTTPAPSSGGCPASWKRFMGRCYKYFSTASNFSYAQSTCKLQGARARSNLVSIRNSFEQMFVKSMLNINRTNAWIGIFIANEQARWIDESPFGYSNWLKTFEDNEICAFMRGGIFPGKWTAANTTACQGNTLKLPFICAQIQNPAVPTPSPTPNTCPKGFLSYQEDACYNFISNPSTWQNAQAVCQTFGSKSHLASITDPFELAYVTSTAKTAMVQSFWIGLNDLQTPNTYKWSDGWPVFLTQWGPGQPDTNPKKQCVLMSINNTQSGANWYTDTCSNLYPALCKYSTIPPPTTQVPGTCSSGWITGSTKCFFIQKNVSIPFTEANFACERQGSNLASFQSAGDVNLLSKQQSIQTSNLMFYIGLYQTVTNGYAWTDGSNANYFNWAKGEPLHPAAPQNTAGAMDNLGKWHNVESHTPLYYICEASKQPVPHTSAATGVLTTTPKCQPTGYKLQLFLEYFDNRAGGGLLAASPKAHCDKFWFTGYDQCDIALKLCVESSQGSPNLSVCSTQWLDLGQVTTNNNYALFVPGKQYGGWSNPMTYSLSSMQWNKGFQVKFLAQDVDSGNRQLVDQNLCKFSFPTGTKTGVANCRHMRANGYPTNLRIAFLKFPVCASGP